MAWAGVLEAALISRLYGTMLVAVMPKTVATTTGMRNIGRETGKARFKQKSLMISSAMLTTNGQVVRMRESLPYVERVCMWGSFRLRCHLILRPHAPCTSRIPAGAGRTGRSDGRR